MDTKAALVESLDAQRAHVLGIVDGLSDAALRQAPLPTGWNCVGMLGHLAVDVEQFWFGQIVAGQPFSESADATSAWKVSPGTPPEEVIALYRAHISRANDIVMTTPLDAPPKQWPDFFGSWRLADLRAILLHVITETACHAGHLDAARELIDGRTWLLL
jgi:uncharacterized damage-inducible protein DinB